MRWLLMTVLLVLSQNSQACEAVTLRIAVAANFAGLITQLAQEYPATCVEIDVISGATGVLSTQIAQGAPFDIFYAADRLRPKWLEQQGLVQERSRQTYAYGLLVFWVPGAEQVSQTTLQQWHERIAMANPRLAPYGLAAEQVMQHLSLSTDVIQGKNIAHAFQFVYSGAAPAGLVAQSQVHVMPSNTWWPIPTTWYEPIEQQRVVLKRTEHAAQVADWLAYMASAAVQQKILAAGYRLDE